MPKWALDPLLTETTPLQGGGGGGEGHGATSNGGGHDDGDSDGEYDSDYSEEDLGRVRGLTGRVPKFHPVMGLSSPLYSW